MKNILNNSIETDNNISEPNIIRCLLDIRRPDWKGSRAWEFVYIGETIIPEYNDII